MEHQFPALGIEAWNLRCIKIRTELLDGRNAAGKDRIGFTGIDRPQLSRRIRRTFVAPLHSALAALGGGGARTLTNGDGTSR